MKTNAQYPSFYEPDLYSISLKHFVNATNQVNDLSSCSEPSNCLHIKSPLTASSCADPDPPKMY